MTEYPSSSSLSLPRLFLSSLVAELDDETIRAIILHGSYARGDAIPLYSDVDLVRITHDSPTRSEHKRFLYRENSLISISSRPLSLYRERFALPEKAIFSIPGVREARILLDKDGAFHALQQEAWAWTWEPLQTAADAYASHVLMGQAEIVLKILRALMRHDQIALADMMLDLFSAVTEAVAVQRGILVRSGNTYFHQVEDATGHDSRWTYHHRYTAGIVPHALPLPSIEERGVASLRLYQETISLLLPHVSPEHWEVIAPTMRLIDQALSKKEAL